MRARPHGAALPGRLRSASRIRSRRVALWLLGALVALGALLWADRRALRPALRRRLAARARLRDGLGRSPRFRAHAGDPAEAWPAAPRPLIPGPVAFYGTLRARPRCRRRRGSC